MSDSTIIAVLLFVILAFIGGCKMGESFATNEWRTEAVRQGKADWLKDKDGYTYFQWKKE